VFVSKISNVNYMSAGIILSDLITLLIFGEKYKLGNFSLHIVHRGTDVETVALKLSVTE
jgi:hypothetical protein